MIRINVSKNAAACLRYFLFDKSLIERERIGVWVGQSCERFGVEPKSMVNQREFAKGLDGYCVDWESMVQRRRHDRRCSYDFAISADKTVSLGALCLGERGEMAIRSSFVECVYDFHSDLERFASLQGNNERRVETGNMVSAVFVHDCSRYGDPHLHAHAVAMNGTIDEGGDWSSLDVSRAYRLHMELDRIFQIRLDRKLRGRGVASKIEKGIARLPIPKALVDQYSTGHRILDSLVEGLGVESISVPKLKHILNDRSRPSKGAFPRKHFDTVFAADRGSIEDSVFSAPVVEDSRFVKRSVSAHVSRQGRLTDRNVLVGVASACEDDDLLSPDRALDDALEFQSRSLVSEPDEVQLTRGRRFSESNRRVGNRKERVRRI